jgi:peptide/nickel transport system permease protein
VWKYIARKLFLALPLIWCVVTLIFVLLELSPGSIADKFFTPETPPEVRDMIVAKYHLDDPAWLRYLVMLRNLVLFDFGRSMAQERPVFDIILESLPNTMLLATVTLCVIFPVGIVLGTIQAVRQNRPTDTVLSVGSLVLYSMPEFWFAMMLQLLVAFYWGGWIADLERSGAISYDLANTLSLPFSGMVDPVVEAETWWEWIVDVGKHLVLPGVAMGIASAAATARYMRSSLLEVIRQDYIRTARAKGLQERTVILRHALRNALLPVVTLIGLSLPALFSGSVVLETIFAWPGMGRVIVDAIYQQDTPLIIACFYVFTLLVVAGNLVADIVYAWVDPRISYD